VIRYVLLCGAALAAPAFAQTPLPSQADISRQRVPVAPLPVPDFNLSIENPEKSAIPTAVDEIEFEVARIEVRGASYFPQSQIDAIFKPLEGRKIVLEDLRQAAGKLEALYKGEGFFLSRVFVPPQEVKAGTLTLQVVEGYVSGIFVEAPDTATRKRIEKLLAPLLAKRPVRLADIENRILTINDMPGVSAESVLRPGAELGQSELVLTAVERDNAYGVSLSNVASDALGPWSIGANAQVQRPFRRAGALDMTVASAGRNLGEVRSGSLRYSEPIGHRGAILSIGGLAGFAEPGAAIRALDVDSFVNSVSLRARVPLKRSRLSSFFLDGGISINRTETKAAGTRIVEDKTRVAELTLSWQDASFGGGTTQASIGVMRGLDIFGASDAATPLPSVRGFDTTFTKLVYSLQRAQPLGSTLSAVLAVQGQYSDDTLLSGETVSFGGPGIGRGYDPALVAGDRGIGGLAELRYDFDWTAGDVIARPQLYVFADYARATTLAQGATPKTTDSLASIGGGVRFELLKRGRIDVQFADARRTVTGNSGRDPRVTVVASFGF
jgi:hemolysin activation/secretion protein